VHNPGRFPITSIDVRIDFTLKQQRLHHNRALDEPSKQLEMIAPVIPANMQKSWTRRIIIDHAEREKLRDTVASVSFDVPDAGRWTTKWPDPEPSFEGASMIRSRLKAHRV
jgi:hypothetical protein